MVESLDWEKTLSEINVVMIKDDEIQENKSPEGTLGHGTFGYVRKGTFKGSFPVAIKELVFNSKEMTPDEVVRDIINEIKAFTIAEKIHPAIVKFYGVWKQVNRICFVFELIDGSDLNKVWEQMDVKRKLEVLVEICDVVNSLHIKKLIHRDIKPSNIMIDNKTGQVRIIDFGTVKIAKNDNTFTVNQKGTDNYMSPELIKIIELEGDEENDIAHFSVSTKVDVWAVGCVISEMFSFPIPDNIKDEKIINLIKMATEVDLEKRCTCNELKEAVKKVISEL